MTGRVTSSLAFAFSLCTLLAPPLVYGQTQAGIFERIEERVRGQYRQAIDELVLDLPKPLVWIPDVSVSEYNSDFSYSVSIPISSRVALLIGNRNTLIAEQIAAIENRLQATQDLVASIRNELFRYLGSERQFLYFALLVEHFDLPKLVYIVEQQEVVIDEVRFDLLSTGDKYLFLHLFKIAFPGPRNVELLQQYDSRPLATADTAILRIHEEFEAYFESAVSSAESTGYVKSLIHALEKLMQDSATLSRRIDTINALPSLSAELNSVFHESGEFTWDQPTARFSITGQAAPFQFQTSLTVSPRREIDHSFSVSYLPQRLVRHGHDLNAEKVEYFNPLLEDILDDYPSQADRLQLETAIHDFTNEIESLRGGNQGGDLSPLVSKIERAFAEMQSVYSKSLVYLAMNGYFQN